jgi:hypothetical protein
MGSFPGVKWLDREADQKRESSAALVIIGAILYTHLLYVFMELRVKY